MPTQSPRTIPPQAVLDSDVCQQFGRPLFAWHPYSGRLSTAGLGLAISKGSVPVKANPTSGVTFSGGGAKSAGASGDKIEFANSTSPFAVGANIPITLWAMFRQNATAGVSQVIMAVGGNTGGATRDSYDISLTGGQVFQMANGNGTSQSAVTGGSAISTNTIYTAMGVYPNLSGGVQTGYFNGVQKMSTGAAFVPSYASGNTLSLMNYGAGAGAARPFNATLYGAMIWFKNQPPRLAMLLDQDPTLMWWWKGKNNRSFYSVPAGAPPAGNSNFFVFM